MFSNNKKTNSGNSSVFVGVIRHSHRKYPIRKVGLIILVAVVVGGGGYKVFPYAKEFVLAKYSEIRGASSYEPIAQSNQDPLTAGNNTATTPKTATPSSQ